MHENAPQMAPLPKHVQRYFWEYDAASLGWDADRDLIIRRLLAAGDWESLCWLRERLGDAALRAWILAHDGRGLSPRQLRFWQLVLDLPAAKVDAWVAERRQHVWERRTAP